MTQTKVLIVDDDETLRVLMRSTLRDEGYQLLEASDGVQALEVVERERPDLILLDVMMPGKDGLAVLEQLKAQEHTREIPVIMVTVMGSDGQVSTCLDAGAVDHVVKPFSPLVLQARVRAALRTRLTPGVRTPTRGGGKLVGFLGSKGGVGVTTVAVNTAVALATPGRSIVLAELRPCFGTVAQQLGVKAAQNLNPLLVGDPAHTITPEAVQNCLTPHPLGVHLLLAPPTLDDRREVAPQQAEGIVRTLTGLFDYAVVDFPSLPSPATTAALKCCDLVVLTVELEATSLAAAAAMLDGLSYWGVDESAVGAVLVAHQLSANTAISVKHARSQLRCPLVGVIPADGDQCLLAFRNGVPLVAAEGGGPTVLAFHELAARLMTNQVMDL